MKIETYEDCESQILLALQNIYPLKTPELVSDESSMRACARYYSYLQLTLKVKFELLL